MPRKTLLICALALATVAVAGKGPTQGKTLEGLSFGTASAVAGKDVIAGQVGMLTCGETTTGTLDPDTDNPLGDGTFFDLYRFDALAGEEITIDLVSDDFDAFLFALDTADLEFDQNDDGGGGTNSRITFMVPVAGSYGIVANSFFPAPAGGYELTLTCAGQATEDPETPIGFDSQWAHLFAWDGIYFQPGNDVDAAVTNQGLALDVQRDNLFGALYTYDTAGDEAFLTLQGTSVTPQGRRYEGPVFRVRGNGTEVAEVGTFVIELIARNGQNAARFTIDSPYLTQSQSEWVRFGLAETDALTIFAGATTLFAVNTRNAAARALLDEIGDGLTFAQEGTMTNAGMALEVISLPANFNGQLVYSEATNRYRLTIQSEAEPGNSVAVDMIANHNDWVGRATVQIGGETVTVANAFGLIPLIER